MYVYLQTEPNLHTVGFFYPNGNWHPESDHQNPEDAAKRVAYLNGILTPTKKEGYKIKFYGDPSVGIPDAEWLLAGEFQFEDAVTEKWFVNALAMVMECASDGPLAVERL